MELKCFTAFAAVLTISIIFTIGKCDSTLNSTTPHPDSVDPSTISTVCNITHKIEGFCVPVKNCITLLNTLNRTEVLTRRCGPRNENSKNPFVCCEKQFVGQESSSFSTTTQRTANKEVQNDTFENLFKYCGFQNIETRIFGGKPAAKMEFPWLGRLLRRDNYGDIMFSCTGALITSKVVLTTAHCLTSESLVQIGDLYAVSFGEHETECGVDADQCLINKKTVIVSKDIPHPDYNKRSRNHDNDIGLIILRDEVRFTRSIAPICLLEESFEPPEYYVAGWGKTETGSVSGVKLKITLPPFAWGQCAKKYNQTNVELTPRQICAGGEEGIDSCQGDSGGPLMVEKNMKWYAAGVVSFGIGCGREGWPAIYAYVPNYIKWIKTTIRQTVSDVTDTKIVSARNV